MNNEDFLNATEVAKICKVGIGKAYSIIKNLNEELEKKGFLTIRGRVNRLYLLERFGLKGD